MSEQPHDQSRRFDLILWGATGFTGQLVAEYLTDHYSESGLRWALAGRDRSKLERVRAALAKRHARAATLPLLLANSHDRESLDALAASTRVVCSTVGPYARHGSELVAACVEHSTDYCDLTGEPQWVRRMIDAHHHRARETGARIVHCCGFDSIPSDLGTLTLQDAAERKHGRPCNDVRYFVVSTKGGASGGTVASIINIFEELGKDLSLRKVLSDPYALNPEGQRSGPDRDQHGPRYDDVKKRWTAPFIMAAINTRIVRRSNALMEQRYGRQFCYHESVQLPRGLRGLGLATAISGGIIVAGVVGMIPPLRSLLRRFVLPAQGEGPSKGAIEAGFFNVDLIGRGRDADGRMMRVRVNVRGGLDPGYGSTAIMLAESALCLALDTPGGALGGVLTPAAAMGMGLVERLRHAGISFDVSP